SSIRTTRLPGGRLRTGSLCGFRRLLRRRLRDTLGPENFADDFCDDQPDDLQDPHWPASESPLGGSQARKRLTRSTASRTVVASRGRGSSSTARMRHWVTEEEPQPKAHATAKATRATRARVFFIGRFPSPAIGGPRGPGAVGWWVPAE